MINSPHHIPATRFGKAPSFDLNFPALPRTVAEVPHLIEHADTDMNVGRLTEIVEADPVVAGAVLRRINSAYHGLRRRVENVRQAVALLGFLEVANIAMTTGLLRLEDTVAGDEQASIFRQIARTCIGASFFARTLDDHLQVGSAPRAATLGLLHGVGRLVLLHNRPEDYEALWLSDESVAPSIHAEHTIFGTDHRKLAALAVDAWNFPGFIGRVLAQYSTPDEIADDSERTCGYIVNAAVYLTEVYCIAPDHDVIPGPTPLTALSQVVGRSAADDLFDVAEQHYERALEHINLMMSTPHDRRE